MSEDNENLQQVLKLQLQIATGMKLQKDVIDFLSNISDWGKREWYYICALDRMPLETLIKMEDEKSSISKIRKVRQDFLIRSYSSLDTVNKEVERLRKEAEEVFEESRSIRNTIMDNLETALEKQAAAQEETIRAKDNIIEMLQKQIEKLEMEREEEEKEYPGACFEKEPQTTPIQITETLSSVKRETKRQGVVADGRRAWTVWRKQMEVRRFVDKYIKGVDLSDQQKDFLLNCIEEGMKPSDVAELAAPGLSIEVMERLKNLKFKEKGENE